MTKIFSQSHACRSIPVVITKHENSTVSPLAARSTASLSTSTVDTEGAAIWIAEYLRYRTNSCDHASAEQKVFVQIDGAPAPATCFVACASGVASAVSCGGGPSDTTGTGDDFLYVVRGALKLELREAPEIVLEAGDAFVIPAGTAFRGYRWPRDSGDLPKV